MHDKPVHHQMSDEQCAKECEMLLRNCAQEVDSIQERIAKLKAAISQQGADEKSLENLKVLNAKLKEADDLLRSLQKH